MSEVQSRGSGSRGRGSYRGGRGGYRGSRGGKTHAKGEDLDNSPSLEEQGEVGEMKAKYAEQLPVLREICSGWSDDDLVFQLEAAGGDVELALDTITTGKGSQWGEVKKKQPKAKEVTTASVETGSRGRGRGSSEGRGRGRGTERTARAGRGSRAASHPNGSKASELPTKTTEETWDGAVTQSSDSKANGDAVAELLNEPGKDRLDSLLTDESAPASAAMPATRSKGWAGLFAKPAPAPAPAPKKSSVPPSTAVQASADPSLFAHPSECANIEAGLPPIEPIQVEDGPTELPSAPHSDTAVDITPSKDELTEKNLDKLPDTSHPLASQTVASTTASTQEPMNPALPAAAAVRPGMSGFAASALKATSGAGRTASYSRKLMEQQEAVVMPRNHAVDRAAVQFGKMGLNGGEDVDADEDREEPETRPQLPDDSPSAPRASLPPAMPESKAPVEAAADEALTTRPAPGLPPVPHQSHEAAQPPAPSYNEQYRYGQGQKGYDPFTQQPQAPGPATTEPFSSQVPGTSQAVPSTGPEYSQYYGGSSRDQYAPYYGSAYGQVDTQRSGGTFGTSAPETQSQYTTSRQQHSVGQQDATSGHNTPNPSVGGHQTQHSQHLPNQGGHGGYPYGYPNTGYGHQYPQYSNYGMSNRYGTNRPAFDDVRRGDDYYNNQYQYGHNQQYGGNYKSGAMYGQPQHQYSHDYASSPATNTSFGGRETSYGRAGSTQPSESAQNVTGNNAFGAMPDPFGRTPSGFGQTQAHGSHQSNEDAAKASGPSPSLQGGRPGSAINNISNSQGNLPQTQSQHVGQGFAGYPQYGGFGNHAQQSSGYGSYGSNSGFGGYGGGYGGRGFYGHN